MTEKVCGICFDSLATGGTMATSCGHDYHTACIQPWLAIKNTCPTCRTEQPVPLDNRQPKFKKGQPVRFNAEKRTEFFQYIRDHPGARMPTVPLRIWTDPHWSDAYQTWVYDYEYDWSSEGVALETDLEAIHVTFRT